MDLTKMFEQDAEVRAPSADDLKNLTFLANEQLRLEKEILDLQIKVGEKERELRTISEERIPTLLTALGMSSFTMVDGSKVEAKPYYAASISDDHKAQAFSWLSEHGHDDIIKNTITVTFGRGENEAAQALAEALLEQGYNYEEKAGVHASTLKAFVKEQIEHEAERLEMQGPFPREIFGVFQGNKTKIIAPKKRKGE